MSIYEASPSPWAGRVLSIFRIVGGVIFITSGTTKIFGFPAYPPGVPAPPIEPWSQIWIGGWLEILGGALIVIGLLTRPTAFVLSGMMAVAYFQFHQPQAFWPTQNGGVAAAMYSFFFLYLVFAGAGEWSVDAAIARSRRDGRAPERERDVRMARA